ncbi:Ig-like domain-containing protein [Rubripirellula amarantea]|nr:Ig-like domain-containing protein [Rubripirellula amarantea]
MSNSIFDGSASASGGTLIGDYNVFSSNVIITGTGNQTNTSPDLLALADNGGPTLTHAISENSPALDMGDPAIVFSPTEFDQRGGLYRRVEGTRLDIGAYEFQFVVDALGDVDNGDFSAGDLTLFEAVGLAVYIPGANTVRFSSLFDTPQTINLNGQLPTIIDDLDIVGPGADLLTVDAGNGTDDLFNTQDGFRILNIDDSTGTDLSVSISGVNLIGGDSTGDGGAIRNRETLTLTNVEISGSAAQSRGGGIFSDGSLFVTNSTIAENAAANGGGLYNGGSADVVQSTLSGNEATVRGGNVFTSSSSTFVVNVSTIADGTAGTDGDAIHSGNSATLGIDNTIVDGVVSGAGNLSGNYNLLSTTTSISGTGNVVAADVGVAALGDYGGTTRTQPLTAGSPAINAGDPSITYGPAAFDQRGANFVRVHNDVIDIGVVESRYVEAQFNLLKDINTLPEISGSIISNVTQVGSLFYFTASTPDAGTELYVSDGTIGGTTMVADVRPGASSSSPNYLTDVNGTLFFRANDGMSGDELWTSDGTAAGTQLVSDIRPGFYSSNPINLTNVGGTLFFSADDGVNGYELWTSDGTSAGTTMVADIRAGSSSSSPSQLTDVGGTLFFSANDGVNGSELWSSDGTAAGTTLVSDIRSGSSSSSPGDLTAVGGNLLFRANDGTSGTELWVSDGTATGTTLVSDIQAGASSSSPGYFTEANGVLYFYASDSTNGREVWTSDGTSAGTTLLSDIRPGAVSSYPSQFTNVGGTVFFRASDGTTGTELWSTDGTTAGTTIISDIRSGTSGSYPNELTEFNGSLIFEANDGTTGTELWISDGTAAGTTLISDIRSGTSSSYTSNLLNFGGTLFFRADDGVYGDELWTSDGTTAGTNLFANIRGGTGNSSVSQTVDVSGTTFFVANNGINGSELWKTDGTEAGTTLVADIRPGSDSSGISNLTNVGGTLFFEANDGTNGSELWKSDGTAAGTVLVSDIRSGTSDSNPSVFANVGGTLFFRANDGTNGTELWKSDGTAAGTVLVSDIRSGASGSFPNYLTNVGGSLFFRAFDNTNGYELWTSDGTAAGTTLVEDIRTGSSSSYPRYLTDVGGTLFFSVSDGVNGRELWTSDGTAAGTNLVSDIRAGSSGAYPADLTNVDGTLFFRASDGNDGSELWKSDGTAAGTSLVLDIRPGSSSSSPNELVNVGGTLYFEANDGVSGNELWKSDGTAAGTVQVEDIRGGASGSYPSQMTNVDGRLYFRAFDGIGNTSVWKIDPTVIGVQNIFDGGGFNPSVGSLFDINGSVFFTATDGAVGNELFEIVEDRTLLVDTIGDTDDGLYTPGNLTLRETINLSNETRAIETIEFGSLFDTAQTIAIGSQLPTITQSVTIEGPGAKLLTIDAGDGTDDTFNTGDGYRVFFINSPASEKIDVTLSGMALTGADILGAGGAIQTYDNLTLRQLTITGNASTSYGGAVQTNSLSDFNVIESTISGNHSGSAGGGFDLSGATTILNSTISGNTASGSGGGFYNFQGSVQVTNSTITGNNASSGSAVYMNAGGTFDGSIFDGTVSGSGTITGDYNLFSDAVTITGSGNQTSTPVMLDVLADNGGPTMTHALLIGSPAFNMGDPTIVFSPTEFDQRGDGFARVVDGRIDIGAFEAGENVPLAVADSVVTTEDTAITVSVLGNDTPSGEVQIIGHSDGTDGTVVDNGDGTLTYTPDTGFTGSDSFDYTIALNDVELINSATSGGDRFGNSVAISGDFAVVGSFLDDPGGLNSAGSAFIYQRTGDTSWTQVAQLTGDAAPNGSAGQFGYSVAIDGDTVAVSAQRDRESGFQAGAVYIFDRNEGGADNWGRVTKLIGSDTIKRDLFGRSLALSGDTVVVGASVADPLGLSSGAAYVFERDLGGVNNWGEAKKLIASDGGAGDRFGQTVSIDGDLIAVGAFQYDGSASNTGAAYIFARDLGGAGNWGEETIIEAADGLANDQFAYSLSIDGTTVAIGSRFDDEGGLNQLGSVYLFDQDEGGASNWGQVTKILADNGVAGDRLGWSVDLSGDRLVAGAIGSDIGGLASGNAYQFENVGGTWTQTRVLNNDEVTTADEYGISIAVDGDVAVVGSWLDNRPSNNTGGAYVFDLRTSTVTVGVTVDPSPSELAFSSEELLWWESAMPSVSDQEDALLLANNVSSLSSSKAERISIDDRWFAENTNLTNSPRGLDELEVWDGEDDDLLDRQSDLHAGVVDSVLNALLHEMN